MIYVIWLIFIDVSDDRAASIFRVGKYVEHGKSGMDITRSTSTGSLSKAVGVVSRMLKELLPRTGRLVEIIALSEPVKHRNRGIGVRTGWLPFIYY
jgi:hypothetical protein